MSLRSSDRQPGTLPEFFPGPPMVLNFASSPFRTLYLCFTMGVVLATCQVLGTPAEQERHADAVPFFHLGCFSPERGISSPAGWTAPIPSVLLGIRHSYCLTPN